MHHHADLPELNRRILHLDMDAFYASVEVLDNPALKGLPVIVGGGVERGVVSAASYEARKFGVHSALPMAIARRRCPNGVFLPVRMTRYHEISDQIFAIFQRFTPLVEPISLDEAFLDVTGCRRLHGPAEELALTLKMLVRRETGLTVSAGVATSKLVAKIASDLEKPDGLTIVEPGREREFLAPLPICKLWGVGKSTCANLELMGVTTIGDLAALPQVLLKSKFGKHGIHMHEAARGIDLRPVSPEHEVKSIGQEETFSRDLLCTTTLRRELLALADKVGWRLRKHGLTARTVTLKIKYNDFTQITRSATLESATDDGRRLYQEIAALLVKTEAGSRPVRLAGVTASNLTSPGSRQLHLFPEPAPIHKRQQVNRALDNISDKYGRRAIRPAILLAPEPPPED